MMCPLQASAAKQSPHVGDCCAGSVTKQGVALPQGQHHSVQTQAACFRLHGQASSNAFVAAPKNPTELHPIKLVISVSDLAKAQLRRGASAGPWFCTAVCCPF